MSKLGDLQKYGQSVWLDFIKRSLISSGELDRLIREDGVCGLTSNPSIFEKAIAESSEYDVDLHKLSLPNSDGKAIFEQLAIADIRAAADAFRPVYDRTSGRDGFVSLEVSPNLAGDTDGTLKEARRLWRAVGRDNLMIKVPGTPDGTRAFETLISEGININVTLLFSVDLYRDVAAAYIKGLSSLAANGGKIERAASVASFFVSRVDTAVDDQIQKKLQSANEAQRHELKGLLGKAAIANAKLAYEQYQVIFSSAEWQKLATLGAKTQRVLWASTGTKNPAYRDVMYVEELVGPDTVNTVPPATLSAFRDHGVARASLTEGLAEAKQTIHRLEKNGISMVSVSALLLEDGRKQFVDAFAKMLAAVDRARSAAASVEATPQLHS